MKEIIVPIESIPTIPESTCWEACSARVEKKYEDSAISIRSCYYYYRTWIIVAIVLLVILIIILILLFTSTTNSYPCLLYGPQTMASTVSIACLQYTWNLSCNTKQPYTFSVGYTGWWNQSPQGTTMIPCRNGIQGTSCGVGSYANINMYMQYCQINYNQ